MNYKLKSLLKKGMTFDYEYDFGSTTELMITVVNYRTGFWKKDKLTILCNSPRMGVCAYEGSDLYPNQFVPDTEKA